MDNLVRMLLQGSQINSEGTNFVKNYPSSVRKANKKLFEKVINGRLKQDVSLFTELFAHGQCAVYSEGLSNTLSRLGYDTELVQCLEKGKPVHYLCKVNHDNNELYVDAYGVFDSIDEIKSRYKNNEIDETKTLDVSDDYEPDDDEYEDVNSWYNLTTEFMNSFDIEEAEDTGEHYSELYDEYLTTIVAKNFEAIYLQNKELIVNKTKETVLGI